MQSLLVELFAQWRSDATPPVGAAVAARALDRRSVMPRNAQRQLLTPFAADAVADLLPPIATTIVRGADFGLEERETRGGRFFHLSGSRTALCSCSTRSCATKPCCRRRRQQ